ncbi:MAG TPA: hypothetical protein VK906_09400 [Egicoccus sp.]|nr:hypothetical protein [Egicoccus sp.]HSK23379.1 hypothetical protein [Egicoccus sp.]
MDPITLLQITHIEQRIARQTAASHNLAVRQRHEHAAGLVRALAARFAVRRTRVGTTACATC